MFLYFTHSFSFSLYLSIWLSYSPTRSDGTLSSLETEVRAYALESGENALLDPQSAQDSEALVDVLVELRKNLDEEMKIRRAFEDNFFRILNPLQVGKLMVKCSKVEAMSPIIAANTLHVASILG